MTLPNFQIVSPNQDVARPSRGISLGCRLTIERALREGDELLQKEELSADDRSIYGEINAAFHSAIHRAGQSRMLRDMLRVSQQVAPSSHRNVIAFEHRDVRRRHDDHHRIYESILYRDGGRVELLMRDHVETVKISLIRSFSRETTFPDGAVSSRFAKRSPPEKLEE